MTTERIDVLAVMDRLIDVYPEVWEQTDEDEAFLKDAAKARAAVAELREAAEQCLTEIAPDWIRLHNALARFGETP